MGQLTTVCVTLCVVLCYFQARGADKYTDENRPYEFGFKIDGEQHRHEKKDENGIIMGEFGFITADGVYHVTVYATDENGNFKILSMKNIRVKPYPTSNNVGERKGHSLSVPSAPSQHLSTPHVDVPPVSSQPLKTPIATKVQQPKQESNSIARSCSHCRIPTTTTPPPKLAVITTNKNYPSQDQNYGNKESNVINQRQLSQVNMQEEFNVGRKYLQNTRTQSNLSVPNPNSNLIPQTGVGLNYQQGFNEEQRQNQLNIQSQNDNYKQADYAPVAEKNYIQGQRQNQLNIQGLNDNYKQSVYATAAKHNNIQGQNQLDIQGQIDNQKQPGYAPVAEQNYSQRPNTNDNNVQKQYQPEYISITKNNSPQGITPPVTSITSGDRQQKSFKDILQAVSPQQQDTSIISPSTNKKPVLVAAQMQLVDKDTNIYHKNPGEVEGLPKGLSKGDMSQLLYTFNYTVAFHGHHEEGYRNGDKIGYYYVTGRNGIRTRVDYVADDKGFHPRISQEALDIQSDEVPKAETEKDEKYGLKGYEFKWLYYPVDSN